MKDKFSLVLTLGQYRSMLEERNNSAELPSVEEYQIFVIITVPVTTYIEMNGCLFYNSHVCRIFE